MPFEKGKKEKILIIKKWKNKKVNKVNKSNQLIATSS